jgi:16S rRNA (guanine527-N7)-methyltransferase
VLAIAGIPGVELVEADGRKCAFLREAARLADALVVIHNTRIEVVPPHVVDVVTARGCAPLERLLVLAEPFIGPETRCLFPKGERAREELTAANQAWTMDATYHDSCTDRRGIILCLTRVGRRERCGSR